MSSTVHPLPALTIDTRRGTVGMWLFVLTEALLFVMLFFAYFYLSRQETAWPPQPEPAPSLMFPLLMLAVLLTSSMVVHWADRAAEEGRNSAGRFGAVLTLLLGAAFLSLQAIEYSHKLAHLTPASNAYGSIFYLLTGVHGMHVGLGVLMLAYVTLLPDLGPGEHPPHRPLHNVAIYWHFVDAVWLAIVGIVYVLPHFTRFS